MEIKGSLGRILRFVFSILNTAIQIHVRDSSVHVSLVGPEAGRSIDDRLESIEAARSALQNALVAVDELARNAEDNKRELADLQRGLEIAAKNKENAVGELEDIKKLAKLGVQSRHLVDRIKDESIRV